MSQASPMSLPQLSALPDTPQESHTHSLMTPTSTTSPSSHTSLLPLEVSTSPTRLRPPGTIMITPTAMTPPRLEAVRLQLPQRVRAGPAPLMRPIPLLPSLHSPLPPLPATVRERQSALLRSASPNWQTVLQEKERLHRRLNKLKNKYRRLNTELISSPRRTKRLGSEAAKKQQGRQSKEAKSALGLLERVRGLVYRIDSKERRSNQLNFLYPLSKKPSGFLGNLERIMRLINVWAARQKWIPWIMVLGIVVFVVFLPIAAGAAAIALIAI